MHEQKGWDVATTRGFGGSEVGSGDQLRMRLLQCCRHVELPKRA